MRWMDEENKVKQTMRMDCERYQGKRKTKNEWMDEENKEKQTMRMDCERYQGKRKTKNEVDG